MDLSPASIKQYHIFLASAGDVNEERQLVRRFFERYNRTIAQLWGVRFEVVDWENYSTVGVGRPQELISQQTLEPFKDSLALVIGIMAQRFGSPTGKAESGTEEEFRWALAQYQQRGFPEIKWFFKRIERFDAPIEPDAIAESLEQWKKVRAFREEVKATPMYVAEYPETDSFRETFESDLNRWLTQPDRPWVASAPQRETRSTLGVTVPESYYETIERDFHRLDIAGIDNDRAFEIPLSEIYVRLRVMFDEELQNDANQITDAEAIDIQTALLRYSKLVIVGDPGSGKSTFLKYVALMLARSVMQRDASIAMEKLCIQEPLPLPVFISCWDVSDFLRERGEIQLAALLDFLAERMTNQGFRVAARDLESLLDAGSCCLLFDGLDEVSTDAGRSMVSRLLEDCVKHFPKNRYVVTSRVRAYTGGTILKGEFARCDIQSFDAFDRAQFLKNWIALLFKTSTEDVLAGRTEPNREFQSLTKGIESNDRIRLLAVNPLLLTVIAIVHWNRKRLPEQRVDLYAECVDVLLGQRKEAEHVQARRKADAFNEEVERQQEEERPWVRKRFAEIALRILEGEGDREEASKSEIIKVLAPRFKDRGAKAQEEAEIQAARFLEKQELRSGLLVSRREHSYRFVHLTFQEYLAAWHLSNQEFDRVLPVIEPHLRQQRWFEPLQLLGGEWANQSDEKLERYLQWLLNQQGQSITQRAPVVALCANIVKDISGVAELGTGTRNQFERALQDTLDAFQPDSRVPIKTQLEILEALGQLGGAVKSHLIDATKSRLNQVRSRAIEMLLPHLSDDELFGLDHLLNDHSKQPIKFYLLCCLTRDPLRTARALNQQERFSVRATDAFVETLEQFEQMLPAEIVSELARSVVANGLSYDGKYVSKVFLPSRAKLIGYLDDKHLLRSYATDDREAGVRAWALREIASRQVDDPQTWKLIRESTSKDGDRNVRVQALELLVAARANDPQTWEFLRDILTKSQLSPCGQRLEFYRSEQWNHDAEMWRQVQECWAEEAVVVAALQLLSEGRKDDPQTWELVRKSVTESQLHSVRVRALQLLAEGQRDDPKTWLLVRDSVTVDDNLEVRKAAFLVIVQHPLVQGNHLFPILPYGRSLTLDPREPITDSHVRVSAIELNTNESRVRTLYEELANKLRAHLGLELKLEWR